MNARLKEITRRVALLGVLVVVFLLVSALSAGAVTGPNILGGDELDGDMLEVTLTLNGGVIPRKWGPNTPGGTAYGWQRTYFSQREGNGLSIWNDATELVSGGYFDMFSTSYSISLDAKVIGANGSQSITRTWTGTAGRAAGIVITEVFRLEKGMNFYTRNVTIHNNTGADLSNVRIYIGGDVFFQGSDFTYGGYNLIDGSAYCYRYVTDGNMTLRGMAGSRPTFLYVGPFSAVRSVVWTGQNFINAGTSLLIDTGYCIQWGDKDGGVNAIVIPTGGNYTIETMESFSDPGHVQVTSPGGMVAPPDSVASYRFTLNSLLPAAWAGENLALNLTATSEHGWLTSVDPSSVTMIDRQTKSVIVNVWVPADAVDGMVDRVTLDVSYSGSVQGAPVTGSASGSAFTTVDSTIPFISDVQIVYLDANTLDARVLYRNLAGSNVTTVRIYDAVGVYTGITATASIDSGGIISGLDVSGLTDGATYYLYVTVEGIAYPHNTTFFIKGQTIVGLESLTLDPPSATLFQGSDLQLTAEYLPADTTQRDVTWTSSDPSIAAVDSNGLVTAVSPGQATITVRSVDNLSLSAQSVITVVIGLTNVGGEATVTYAGSPFDLSTIAGLFTIDANAGTPTYTLESGGTGIGTLNGSLLTVTKAGTFNIGLTTAPQGDFGAGQQVIGVLTVLKAAGAPVSVPTVSDIGADTMVAHSTLLIDTGQSIQYAVSTDPTMPGAWQSSPQFSGLKPNTRYYLFARSVENDLYLTGPWSVSVPFTTLDEAPTPATGDSTALMTWLVLFGLGTMLTTLPFWRTDRKNTATSGV